MSLSAVKVIFPLLIMVISSLASADDCMTAKPEDDPLGSCTVAIRKSTKFCIGSEHPRCFEMFPSEKPAKKTEAAKSARVEQSLRGSAVSSKDIKDRDRDSLEQAISDFVTWAKAQKSVARATTIACPTPVEIDSPKLGHVSVCEEKLPAGDVKAKLRVLIDALQNGHL
jgi:hypothetical protein